MNPAFDHLDDRLDDDPKGKKAVAAKHEKKRSLDENKSSDEKKSSDMGAYPVVDIHTHMYPMTYFITLLGRTSVPYIHRSLTGDYRLIILPSDDNPSVPVEKRGRPIDASYYDVKEKFKFMEMHGIATSVISLANPWLDFAEPQFAAMFALEVNDELERMCAISHARMSAVPLKKTCTLYAFGSLPLKASPAVVVAEIARLSKLKYTKGIIMGTTGLGNGLDDHALEPIWKALEEHQTLIFLHPHYGLPAEAYGGEVASERYGHVLHLALGFPLETTIAVTRMFLSGVFDRYPQLKVLLAHSGGTLPFLAGRIESCIAHERTFTLNGGQVQGPIRDIWSVLKRNIWLDAVIYGDVGLRAAMDAAGSSDRLLFGTDHPFFPPLEPGVKEWPSVTTNRQAIIDASGKEQIAKAILGGNAVRLLGLDEYPAFRETPTKDQENSPRKSPENPRQSRYDPAKCRTVEYDPGHKRYSGYS